MSSTSGVARYTTESIGWLSAPIAKSELRPGDAMNLRMDRDPEGYGQIRLFEAWANEARTLVWVYEETPPRAVHRVVVYVRSRDGLLVLPLGVTPTSRSATGPPPTPSVRPTPRPTRTPIPSVTVRR